ncbi:hypothetical protein Y032_0341g3000, partial [Ancylostoma ceylanicum]
MVSPSEGGQSWNKSQQPGAGRVSIGGKPLGDGQTRSENPVYQASQHSNASNTLGGGHGWNGNSQSGAGQVLAGGRAWNNNSSSQPSQNSKAGNPSGGGQGWNGNTQPGAGQVSPVRQVWNEDRSSQQSQDSNVANPSGGGQGWNERKQPDAGEALPGGQGLEDGRASNKDSSSQPSQDSKVGDPPKGGQGWNGNTQSGAGQVSPGRQVWNEDRSSQPSQDSNVANPSGGGQGWNQNHQFGGNQQTSCGLTTPNAVSTPRSLRPAKMGLHRLLFILLATASYVMQDSLGGKDEVSAPDGNRANHSSTIDRPVIPKKMSGYIPLWLADKGQPSQNQSGPIQTYPSHPGLTSEGNITYVELRKGKNGFELPMDAEGTQDGYGGNTWPGSSGNGNGGSGMTNPGG